MPGSIHIIFVIAVCFSVASIAYCLLCIWAGVRFARWRTTPSVANADLPPISILKPLKGSDPQMYEALRSHCLQDYPGYEILFGVSSAGDPAAALANKLIAEFPARTIKLVLCEKRLGSNGKVSTLAQLLPLAEYELLLINDGDIRVEPDYLRTLTNELLRPGIGMVTCLYRGVPAATLPSKIEALSISTDFAAGVLAARTVERGLNFGLGSTLAFRRGDFEKFGGFASIADYLADDYELGRRIAELGKKVELSRIVVETHLPAYGWRDFFLHQLRWARTIRASRPGGYAGLVVTFTLPWALVAYLLKPQAWTGPLLVAAILARYMMAAICAGSVLKDRRSTQNFWLLPLRDFLAVAIWIGGLFGRKIAWRGERFTLKNGKLISS